MSLKQKHIVILGGGSAGWMTAAYLSKYVGFGDRTRPRLTLIEAPGIAPIGVGEATLPHLNSYLDALEISKPEWLRQCNGTVKFGQRLMNWSGRVESDNDYWSYPFQRPQKTSDGYTPFECWVEQCLRGEKEPFSLDFVTSQYLMNKQKGPRLVEGGEVYDNLFSYAFHFDAALNGEYCKKIAIDNGLVHIEDKIKGASLHPNGEISCLHSEAHGDISGDFFIDCSGFRRELIGKVLKEPYHSYSDSLLCDSAVVMHIPRKDDCEAIDSYTKNIALSSGWLWEIPLGDRTSYGYVYSSSFLSEDEAEKELREFLGQENAEHEARHIPFAAGHSQNYWVKNCVAIGLSGGFIEPLASTGLHLAQLGIENLANYFPVHDSNTHMVDEYNRIMRFEYHEVYHFIVSHYCTTGREDTPFWKANKYDLVIPSAVQEILERWKKGRLLRENMWHLFAGEFGNAFGIWGYLFLFTGMRYLPNTLPGMIRSFSNENTVQEIRAYQNAVEEKAEKFCSHMDFLKSLPEIEESHSTSGKPGEAVEVESPQNKSILRYGRLFTFDNFSKVVEKANAWLMEKNASNTEIAFQIRERSYVYTFDRFILFKCPKAISSSLFMKDLSERLDQFFQWKPDFVSDQMVPLYLQAVQKNIDQFIQGEEPYQFLDMFVEAAYRREISRILKSLLLEKFDGGAQVSEMKEVILHTISEELDNEKITEAMKQSAEKISKKEMFTYEISRFLNYPIIPPLSLASFEIQGRKVFGIGQLYMQGGFNGAPLMDMPLQQRVNTVEKIHKSVFDMCIVFSALLMNSRVNLSNICFFRDGHLAVVDNQEIMPHSNTNGYRGVIFRNWLMAFPQAERVMDSTFLRSIARWDQRAMEKIAERYFPDERGALRAFKERLQRIKELCEAVLEDGDYLTPRDFIFKLYPDYKAQWDLLVEKGYPLFSVAIMAGTPLSNLLMVEDYRPGQNFSSEFLTLEEFEMFSRKYGAHEV